MVGLWIGVLFAAALPLLLLVSLHVCLAGCGSALGCRCSAAAPACLPSCLPCWPLSPFLWLWSGAWLPLLCRCSCLSPFMFDLDDVKLEKSQNKNANSMDTTLYQSKKANQSKLWNNTHCHIWRLFSSKPKQNNMIFPWKHGKEGRMRIKNKTWNL